MACWDLALIVFKPELFSSGLSTSRASSMPAKPFGRAAATRLKNVLACPGSLLGDDADDPELSGLENAPLFKELPRPAHQGGGLFQTAGLCWACRHPNRRLQKLILASS
jgi:hypothetical protein